GCAGAAYPRRPRARHRGHGRRLSAADHPLPVLPGPVGAPRRAGGAGRRPAGRAAAAGDELKEGRRQVEYRRLGASGVRVSEIGLGSWLTYGVGVEAARAKACVARAYELGVNFFDTADVYGRGAAEEV